MSVRHSQVQNCLTLLVLSVQVVVTRLDYFSNDFQVSWKMKPSRKIQNKDNVVFPLIDGIINNFTFFCCTMKKVCASVAATLSRRWLAGKTEHKRTRKAAFVDLILLNQWVEAMNYRPFVCEWKTKSNQPNNGFWTNFCLSWNIRSLNFEERTDAVKSVISKLFDHIMQNVSAEGHREHVVAFLGRVTYDVEVPDEKSPVSRVLFCWQNIRRFDILNSFSHKLFKSSSYLRNEDGLRQPPWQSDRGTNNIPDPPCCPCATAVPPLLRSGNVVNSHSRSTIERTQARLKTHHWLPTKNQSSYSRWTACGNEYKNNDTKQHNDAKTMLKDLTLTYNSNRFNIFNRFQWTYACIQTKLSN